MRELIRSTNEQDPNEQEWLTAMQQQSLHGIDSQLQAEKHHDGTDKWWRFFDAGVRDGRGAVWALYNNFHDQESPEGWRIFCCPPDGEQFQRLHVGSAYQSIIPSSQQERLIHTVQFDVGGEENRTLGMVDNDILNLMFQGDRPPSVKFWSDRRSMVPVAAKQIETIERNNPIIAMSSRALAVEQPAA